MMEKNCFIFDVRKCVGCNACVVGCSNANNTMQGLNWRSVTGFNNLHHPGLPVFSHSVACNHCENAPCIENCPSSAYSRDILTGAVIHEPDRCIGCKLCTWACPYDAPKYNKLTGIVEKCNFCVDRVSEGELPACSDACPTGALSYGKRIPNGDQIETLGFVNQSTEPRVHLITHTNGRWKPEILTDQADSLTASEALKLYQAPVKSISAAKEWSLVGFTLTMPVLVAWISAAITHDQRIYSLAFFAMCFMSVLVSIMHLGRIGKAYKAVYNFRHSWLSREIISLSAFFILSLIYLLSSFKQIEFPVIISGILLLVSIDFVYLIVRPSNEFKVHSSSTVLTGLLLWGLFTGQLIIPIVLVIVKLALYIYRQWAMQRSVNLLMLLRVLLLVGILTSTLFSKEMNVFAVFAALMGEVIDRIAFYNETKVMSPGVAMYKSLSKNS